ncbi:damage-control phosphatase ARMT1 family protein [Sunxiuqinia rutila]|uniref:damage-control phosphatase ARMT1 family protein n=1 Tax=Sunxiuqinia rutila TaxID=1397841 RepID=UPI003D3624E3
MINDYRCFFCFNRAFEKLLKREKLSSEQALSFTHEMVQFYMENQEEYSTPQLARELHLRFKKYNNQEDPYRTEKKQSNDVILNQYQKFKAQVESSEDPFNTALRLAIAGNIIDAAVSETYRLDETIDHVLNSDFAIDHSNQLKSAIQKAQTVLYLGDNNGEIVLDKLFIETIHHPNLVYAVRDQPIINDATMSDAHYVGMTPLVPVISNGYDAPSTILEQCSDEFLRLYNQADVIISKGQGNLEGLLESGNEKIFFLLMVKCDVIAKKLGVSKGDFVVTRYFNPETLEK